MLASATQDLEEGRSQPLVTAVHYRYRCGAYSRCLALGVCESEARPKPPPKSASKGKVVTGAAAVAEMAAMDRAAKRQ